MNPADISIEDYSYHLPAEKIAHHPLPQREASKLLIWRGENFLETHFRQIADYLPEHSLLVFNDTKVIRARLKFVTATGALVEIFCLEPAGSVQEYTAVMQQRERTVWKCLIGNAAKWKEGSLTMHLEIEGSPVLLEAKKLGREEEAFLIEFAWQPGLIPFAEILEAAGKMPLPPYIKRETEKEDEERYQTIFAQHAGSVAAPTAGLHFSPEVIQQLEKRHISRAAVTLHVGAGTFKPVKAARMQEHHMHAEHIQVGKDTIKALLDHTNITAVGTTSLRTLESLYWIGVKLLSAPHHQVPEIFQWDVYGDLAQKNYSKEEVLTAVLEFLEKTGKEFLFTKTQLLIAPGYRYRICQQLITNFHQPQSTLLLLVAAATPHWKQAYEYALEHEFRFLSYGDSNLIFIEQHA